MRWIAELIRPLFGLNHTPSVIETVGKCIMGTGHDGEIGIAMTPVAALFYQTITRELLGSEI